MMSSRGRGRPVGQLRKGEFRKLTSRYLTAHRAYAQGQFGRALSIYGTLARALAPHFAAIVRRNLGFELKPNADLSEEQVSAAIASTTQRTIDRLRLGTPEERTASLCAAVAHDVALLGRHIAEEKGKGRDPEVAKAIIAGFAHAIAVNPLNASTYHNLGGYEDYIGRITDAAEHYRAAVQLNPHQSESWVSLGHCCMHLRDPEGAETCWDNAFRIIDAVGGRHWHMAMLRLLKGDYARGWAEYEERLTFPPYLHGYGRSDITTPKWDGAPVHGTVLMHSEQGAGDTIMMARYIPLAKPRVDRLIVEVIAGQVRLFERALEGTGIEVLKKGDPIPTHDFNLPMMSCPAVFGTTSLEAIPPAPTFESDRVPRAKRIGICWKGSSTHPNDLLRSMRFEDFFPVLDLHKSIDLTFQSLQFGFETSPPLDPCPIGDYQETADAIAECEVVITIDTSVAHLAACMGVETWLLLPHHAEWRWLQGREDSPWYPAMKLLRQALPGDWPGLMKRVVSMLRARYGAEEMPEVAAPDVAMVFD